MSLFGSMALYYNEAAVKEKEDKNKNDKNKKPPILKKDYRTRDYDTRIEHRYNNMDDDYKSGGYIGKLQKDMERHPYYYESGIFESVQFI